MARFPKIAFFLISVSILLTACTDSLGDRYVGFADCLTQKGVKMYGAYWCPKCNQQKKMFGKEAFRKIQYVECDPRGADANPELCLNKKIQKYPTWEFSDESMTVGVKDLSVLAEKTACTLPPAE